jgi:hypothetical protein
MLTTLLRRNHFTKHRPKVKRMPLSRQTPEILREGSKIGTRGTFEDTLCS